MSSQYRIETLSKKNYDTWCLHAQAVLIKNDLWEYVSGEKLLPDKPTPEITSQFAKKDLQARAELLLLISPSELKQIKGCTSSKEVWEKLKSTYKSTGPARKATLLKQLVLKRMNPTEDVRDHLNNFMDVVDKLEEMDVDINAELLSIMMLYSLPPSYENFRIAIESRDKLPNPHELKIKIIEEGEARNQCANTESTEALYVKNRRKNSYQLNICKNCNKKGHSTEACWFKKNGQSSKKGKENKFQNREKNFNICLASENEDDRNMWCLDSGCTSHMSGEKNLFQNLNPETNLLKLASKNTSTEIEGKGKIKISADDETFNLTEALYVPNITTNLLSVGKITDNGYKVLFEKQTASIIEDGDVILQAQRNKNGLYYVNVDQEEPRANLSSENEAMIWHKKLGHINEKDLRMMTTKGLMRGLELKEVKLPPCETCIKGKLSALPFTSHDHISSEPLEIIHSDVCGPFETESLAGSRYYVSFIDDYSRYCCIYFIKSKSEVIEKFKEYKSRVEMFTKKKIQNLQSDNGGEYKNKEFDNLLKQYGIHRRLTN